MTAKSDSTRTNKRCAKCGETHEISNFNRDKQQLDGFSVYCKPCRKQKNADRYLKNKEKINAQTNAWKSVNADKRKKASLKWYAENANKVCADSAEYRRKNKAKVNSLGAAYKASKRLALPSWANKHLIEEVYSLAHELSRTTGIKPHVDHIVPLQSNYVCGLHCESNLRAITWKENRNKSNSHWPDMP